MLVNPSIRCILIYSLLFIPLFNAHDVFDMFNSVKDQLVEKADQASAKVKEKVQKHVLNLKDGETCPATFTNEYRTVLAAYRQTIRDWLEKFPSKNEDRYRFLVDMSSTEFDELKRFASSANYDEKKGVLSDVHKISEILKRMIHTIEADKPSFDSLTWAAWLRSFDINGIVKSVMVLVAIGAISLISIRTHLRRGRWFSTIFIVGFVFSVAQNWYALYQDAQAKVDQVLMKKLPKHCQGHTMGFFDSAKAFLGRFVQMPVDECLQYHKALRATPHSLVTPVQALSVTFAQLFTTPMGAIGESISQFFAGTLSHIPVFLWPVMICLVVFIVIMIGLMYSRYELHLPFMMGSLRPSPHAALPPRPEPIEQLEANASARVIELESRVNELQLQLQKRAALPLERPSRSSSTRGRDRDRSVSAQRSPPPPGFRDHVLE